MHKAAFAAFCTFRGDLSHGCLLSASFRPAEQVVVLRSYLRQRQMLIRYAGQHVQHMQKALEEMNVKLTEVINEGSGQKRARLQEYRSTAASFARRCAAARRASRAVRFLSKRLSDRARRFPEAGGGLFSTTHDISAMA